MKILVTGAAGFIGYHISKRLSKTHEVIGLDNFNDYYNISLKESRVRDMSIPIYRVDITDEVSLQNIFNEISPDIVIHMAAQAGVRYSFKNPEVYIQTNIRGFQNVLRCCRDYGVKHNKLWNI